VLRHPALKSLQYGNPEMHDLRYDYSRWSKNKTSIAFWGYNQDYDFLNKAKEIGIKTGMTFACKAASQQEAAEILKNHIEGKRA
jgi:cytochrome c2